MLPIVEVFLAQRNEEQAESMQRYMKDQFSFLGIASPLRKKLQKEFLKSCGKEDEINSVMILQLWSYAEREFQYLAIDYLIKEKKKLQREHIQVIETLIVTKSWWDTVDLLAGHLVGHLCKEYPELVVEYILPWSTSDNMWLRRTAILYQLKYKGQVDTEILTKIVEENQGDKEFFIRKAIGWMLREYSKTNPQWVIDFVEQHPLSNLSKRESLKAIRNA